MRIWRLEDLGDPIDQLRLVDEPAPTPGPGQVAVRVEAVGLAFPDVLQCRGQYQVKSGPGFVPGGETCGVIDTVGEGVTGFDAGQRVVFLGGGLAETVVARAPDLISVPDGVEPATAAALPINYGTTWFALHDRARIQDGEWLLVTGAAGGTGTAAIELGRAAGARVVAVAGGNTKVQLCRDLGAEVVIDHTQTPDWVDTVRQATGGGVDVAYDPVGGDTFHQVRRCMAWDGRLLIIGFVAGIPDAPMNHVLLKNYQIVGVHWGASLARRPESIHEQMGAVLDLCATGRIQPPLYPPVGLGEAARALQDIAERKVWGKVVVTV
jgi:NADPH:quinone reductase